MFTLHGVPGPREVLSETTTPFSEQAWNLFSITVQALERASIPVAVEND